MSENKKTVKNPKESIATFWSLVVVAAYGFLMQFYTPVVEATKTGDLIAKLEGAVESVSWLQWLAISGVPGMLGWLTGLIVTFIWIGHAAKQVRFNNL